MPLSILNVPIESSLKWMSKRVVQSDTNEEVEFLTDVFFFLDVNECKAGTYKCDAQASCSNTIGSYTCKCNPGWENIEGKCQGN